MRGESIEGCSQATHPQEYEQRLAQLKADYQAEQESRARLEEDITAMRNSYDMKLSTLEENLRKETGGCLGPGGRLTAQSPPWHRPHPAEALGQPARRVPW